MSIKLSVIIPAYNEEKNLPNLARRIHHVLNKSLGNNWEMIVVNDNSTDKSEEILKTLAKRYSHLRFVTHAKNRGQTGCFETGFKLAKGKYSLTMDGDLQLLPEDIPLFLERVDAGYELVNAIREKRKHTLGIQLVSRVYNLLSLIFFKSPVNDAASNFTAIKTKYVKNVKLYNNDHRYIIFIAQRRGLKKITEVEVRHQERKEGESKYKLMTKILVGFPELFFAWLRIKLGVYD